MAIYSPEFNVNNYELRGGTEGFFNPEQIGKIISAEVRIPSQLNWIGQLLGWRGDEYWNSFNATVDQKRQLLTGSFGIYNGFIYPEIIEIRNWSNEVVVKYDSNIREGQVFYLGIYEYLSTSIVKDNDNLVVTFSELSNQFLTDISNGLQLRAIAPSSIPSPFIRKDVGVSADRSFLCETKDGKITLYPLFDTGKTLPYIFNTLYAGARYYFSLPVKLTISDDYYIAPTYDFVSETWFIDVPCEFSEKNTELSARLDYGDYGEYSLVVSIALWSDPSDWVTKNKIENFTGVWGNKGGFLPFHFAFDSLSLHGFDERKSLYLQPVSREIEFDTLLDLVYQQITQIDSVPPPITKKSQVWWNSQTGKFSIHTEDLLNCGPWAEVNYSPKEDQKLSPDFVFPDVSEFRNYTGDYSTGDIVQIIDCTGLNSSDAVLGITSPLQSAGQVIMFKPEGVEGWFPAQFIYSNVSDFDTDSPLLPPNVKTSILDSDGLSPTGTNYVVANLSISVSGNYNTLLMKNESDGSWFLSPPSELRYIGNTRLFQSSIDFSNPVEGEMVWDFNNPDVQTRSASIFYYNRWEYNLVLSQWELKGDWVSINSEVLSLSPPPSVVEFGAILVYCDGTLLTDGVNHLTDDYQISYTINPTTGKFEFNYVPRNYAGMVKFPRITVSDSLTTSFVREISDLVFSGLQYYMSPNVSDSETLLRVKKDYPLYCTDDNSAYTKLNYPNSLVADTNSGPLSLSWERYYIRLAPSFQRNGAAWQKVNLICQDFGYWGSPSVPEDMSCPAQESKPEIYEEVYLLGRGYPTTSVIYSEPYLYSTALPYFVNVEDYENAALLPSFDLPYDTFSEAEVTEYDALHERRADTSAPMGRGYGDWKGEYFRAADCSSVTGHLVNDLVSEVLDPVDPPIWDSSIYKFPQTCLMDKESGVVDANHYKVGYAFFAADLSAAEEAVFSFG